MLTTLDYADKLLNILACAHTWPELFPIHMQPVSANFSYQFLIKFAIGGPFFNFFLVYATQLLEISLNETPAHKMTFLHECHSYIFDVF